MLRYGFQAVADSLHRPFGDRTAGTPGRRAGGIARVHPS